MNGLAARLLLASAILALPGPLCAQNPTTGAIDGTVADENVAPLSGVTLEARSASLQGVRVTSSDPAGRFRFPQLPPGVYAVTARRSGFRTVERGGVRVALTETADLALTMQPEMSTEMEVRGEVPLLDVASSTGGQNVREDVIRTLPVGRNYADILRISPGVATDNADTQGRAVPFTIYGSTSLENQYLVDGANTTNVIRGFQGKALPNEFVEEVQIKTSGYEAEYGRATGGIVNVITKSGGNELHGDAFGYFGTRGLTAASKARAETDMFFVDRSAEDRRDYGADLGGPLLRDRLWFFGAYNRVDRDQDQRVLADTGYPSSGQNFPLAFSADIYSGKLTWRVAEETTFVATVFGDPERREGSLANYQSANPVIREGIRDIGGTDATVSATRLFGARGLANLRWARHRDRYEVAGKSDGVKLADYTQRSGPPIVSGGFGAIDGALDNNTSLRNAWKADGTLFAGDHEIKGGLDYERNRTDATGYYTGGQIVGKLRCSTSGAHQCPAGETVFFEHDFYTSSRTDPVGGRLDVGRTQSPRTNRIGVFLQDGFRLAPNLTVNAGIRWDREDVRDYDNQRIFLLNGEWQPRVGIAWDVLKDGRSRLSASFGRFYYALPTDASVRAYQSNIIASTFNFSPTSLEQAAGAPYQTQIFGGQQAEPVDANLKGIYQDEVTFGFERAFDSTLSVGARYTYRNLGRVIEDRCDLDPGYPEARDNGCVLVNPGSGETYATGRGVHGCDGRGELLADPGANPPDSYCSSPSIYPLAPIGDAKRRYHGVELVVRKQVKDVLFLQASYLYSSLRGNYDGAASNSFGSFLFRGAFQAQSDPGINQDFDYAFLQTNAYGRLFLDRPHSFRVDASYTSPFGLSAGVQAYLRSGAPLSRLEAFGIYGYASFASERGSEGRLPWEYEINLQVQYAFKLAGLTVTAFAQGFNLLNRQTPLDQEQQATLPPTEPDYVNPDYGKVKGRRDPRSFRFGARVSF